MQQVEAKLVGHYEVLEVSQSASPEVIRAAYKSLMQRYHPDRNPGDTRAAARSVRVAQAYEVLSDPGRRARYDQELNRRSVTPGSADVCTRAILAASATREKDGARRVWLSLLFAPLALVIGLVSFLYGWDQPAVVEPQRIASVLAGDTPGVQSNPRAAYAIPVAARTIPALFKDVQVSLMTSSSTSPSLSANSGYVLSIKSIGVVAGGFEPERFMSFMESNREYIERKLIEKLATADLMRLIRSDGELFLKRQILDALAEITGTEQSLTPSSSGMNRYGAEDILLPDSFSVTSQQ